MPGRVHRVNGGWTIGYYSFVSRFTRLLTDPTAPLIPSVSNLHPVPLPLDLTETYVLWTPSRIPAPPIPTPRRFPFPTNLSLGCGVRREQSPPPGGCSVVGEGALCMDGGRPPGGAPLGASARCLVRAALFPAREAVSTAVRAPCLPLRLLSPLQASATLSVPLPPTPFPGCAYRLSAPPPPQDARERGPAQRWLPGGRRAWAEPGAEAGGGGREPGPHGPWWRHSRGETERGGD